MRIKEYPGFISRPILNSGLKFYLCATNFLITVYHLNLSKMPAKIRLQRHGRKRFAYYHIVIADSRAPRDGSNVERIGSYNPNTNPATCLLYTSPSPRDGLLSR